MVRERCHLHIQSWKDSTPLTKKGPLSLFFFLIFHPLPIIVQRKAFLKSARLMSLPSARLDGSTHRKLLGKHIHVIAEKATKDWVELLSPLTASLLLPNNCVSFELDRVYLHLSIYYFSIGYTDHIHTHALLATIHRDSFWIDTELLLTSRDGVYKEKSDCLLKLLLLEPSFVLRLLLDKRYPIDQHFPLLA